MTPWLNYHHQLYFWTVAREGSITAACRRLDLSQPTVSVQIRALEQALKAKLLVLRGISWHEPVVSGALAA